MLNFKKLKSSKRLSKEDKIKQTLFGLVDLYIKDKKPIGSQTLYENGFDYLSPATIRNYFATLEKDGYIKQKHSSGGRAPTDKGLREYANEILKNLIISKSIEKKIENQFLPCDKKRVSNYLNSSIELLSNLCHCPAFIITPKFSQDFIQNIKIIPLEEEKLLCVVITDYGLIKTFLISSKNLENIDINQIEKAVLWLVNKAEKPDISESTEKFSKKIYSEIMLRFVANVSSDETLDNFYKTGISKLLDFPEFKNPKVLGEALSFFEKKEDIKTLLYHAIKINCLSFWIGEELSGINIEMLDFVFITIPYKINQLVVGAIALMLPKNCDYKKIFTILKIFSKSLSENLTKAIYKYKIDFQTNQNKNSENINKTNFPKTILLEDKS